MSQNWTITVGNPLLTQGMSFFVRYRKKTEQTWTNFLPNPTTNTFTIPNLDEVDYEAEISTICQNGDISSPVYHQSATEVRCISPTLLDIGIDVNNEISYSWNNNTFNYGPNGTSILQMSYDSVVWNNVATANAGSLSNFAVAPSTFNGQPIYFRIVNQGNGCVSPSNVIRKVWGQTGTPTIGNSFSFRIPVSCQSYGNSPTNFDTYCSGKTNVTFAQILNVTSGSIRMTNNGNNNSVATSLSVGQIKNVTDLIDFQESSTGSNPSSYPFGQLGDTNYTAATYQFEYSINGSTNWQTFTLLVYAQE